MRILVKYPTRGRPAVFLSRLREWYDASANAAEISWLVSYDINDETMPHSVVAEAHGIVKNLRSVRGENHSKIAACNADIAEVPEWDVLLLISDDMECRRIGWDSVIRQKMFELYPDTDGCLWFHDGTKQRQISTLSCIGRKYYDRFGYIYHPSYYSFFCDNEYTEIAMAAGKMTFIEQGICTHEHPAWGGTMQADATYKRNNRYWRADEDNYSRRKANGFPVK